MKKTTTILAAVFLLMVAISMTPPKVTRVVFFGDSITEMAVQPQGFITKIKDALTRKGLGGSYDLIGAGVGGNKVYDLYLRMDDDVMSKNPDVVVVYVGVNDVWHKSMFGTGTDPDKFEKFYTAIIKKLQDKKIKVVLCTPAVIGEKTDFSNQQDGDMNKYAQIVRNLAIKYNCSLCDLRKEFLAYNIKNNTNNVESGILTVDKVHLNDKGNQMVVDCLMPLIMQGQ